MRTNYSILVVPWYLKLYVLLVLMLILTACGGGSTSSSNKYNPGKSTFNALGNIQDVEGTDLLSSSTNQSEKSPDLFPRVNGLAGAAYVKPPQVNHFGTVSMGYSIDVPPGRAGMQPSVNLGYSSSSGDGLTGIGWSLGTGLGVISRSTQYGQLYYDERDVFTYNGSRLVKVSGAAYSEEGIYRREIESDFMRFELRDSASGGSWYVYDTNGTVTVYGEEQSQRIYHPDYPNRTYSWYFTRSEDINGNYMEAVYDDGDYDDNHILYLREIRYTGNRSTGFPAHQFVRFILKDRDEAYVSKAPGFIMRMDKILDRIVVGWDDPTGGNDKELWRYDMVYEISDDSNRFLLKTIESTRNSTKPELIYQPAVHTFAWNVIANPDYSDPELNPEATQYFEGDFNGDGISDMVFFNPRNGYWKAAEGRREGGYAFKTYGNRFQGYEGSTKIQWFKGNVTGDYNGDGRSDIAFYLPENREFWVAEHNGQVFSFRMYGRQYLTDVDIFGCEWFTGDYDGDGLSDAVLFNEKNGSWILMRNTGGAFSFIKFSQHFKNLFRGDYVPNSNLDSPSTMDSSPGGADREKIHFLSGDYNGDGRTDISIYDARDGKWYVAENYRDDSLGFRLEWKLYKVFTAPEMSLFGHDRFSGDFNGDGFSDFLLFDRESGQWILGETGNGTIDFRIVSRVPQFKDITRWLQGDFNGDGRTDIGFYSKTDRNFWIGEAVPDGFRYRIYNNMEYGPDHDRVMSTPLPRDEVVMESASAVITTGTATYTVDYQYDGNRHADHGELHFAGAFTGAVPELLLFNRHEKALYFKSGSNDPYGVSGVSRDLTDPAVTILNQGRPGKYRTHDGILYHSYTGSLFGGRTERFGLIHHNGAAFADTGIAVFDSGLIASFSIAESLYMVDSFMSGEDGYVMVLDDLGDGKFHLFNGASESVLVPGYGGTAGPSFDHIFSSTSSSTDRSRRASFRFFSGNFDTTPGGNAQILMVDMRASTHRWYIGEVDTTNDTITFFDLSGSVGFVNQGYTGEYRVQPDGRLVYATTADGRVQFHRITVSGSGITQTHYNPLDAGVSFNGDYDHSGNPVVTTAGGRKVFSCTYNRLENFTPAQHYTTTRPDLLTKVYPFRWIQGDYNGDGKTDIGLFHLKERYWYFANTTGTVPDLLYRVKNGIGGFYEMAYINSTSVDNTGDDSVPDLPINYKVCDRVSLDDGRANRIVTRYEYAGGYAFSAYINGKKETDYFGFSEFKIIDALGGKTINTHNTVPYDDFMLNRALSGAIKESRLIGSDLREYRRTTYEYEIHAISPVSGLPPKSYMAEAVRVVTHMRDSSGGALVPYSTTESHTTLVARQYAIDTRAGSVIDHYQDGVHSPATIESHTRFEYIESNNQMRKITEKKYYGSSHEVTSSFAYDGRGNVSRESTSYTGSGLQNPGSRILDYDYDDFGNRIRVTNSSGSPSRIGEYSFDERLHQFVTEERTVLSSENLVRRFQINYASAFGGMAIKTDENGNNIYYDYDNLGRLGRVRADAEGGTVTMSDYTYGTEYPLSALVTRYSGTGDMDVEQRSYFDGMGREIHAVRSLADQDGARYVRTGTIVYDPLGRVIRKGQTSWAASGEIDQYVAGGEKNPTVTDYDPIGRVRKVTLPKAHGGESETSITTTYLDPWVTRETHSVGRSKTVTRNARGLVLYVEDAGIGDDNAEVNARMGFYYDLAGNRVKKMDIDQASMDGSIPSGIFSPGSKDTSGNNIACWRYDGFGRLVESSDPDLGYTGYTRNGFGDVIAQTDALDRSTLMSYDRAGRLIEKNLPGQEGVVIYTYDETAGSRNGRGRLVSIDDPSQRKILSYDRLGRVDRETRYFKNLESELSDLDKAYETVYTHDLLNRVSTIQYPADPRGTARVSVRYRHVPAGVKRISVTYEGGTRDIVESVRYNEFGQMISMDRGNNVTTSYEYDVKGRLTNLLTTTYTNEVYTSIQDVSYTFKIDNSIARIENAYEMGATPGFGGTISHTYAYDGLNRLSGASGCYQKTERNGFGLNDPPPQKYERAYGYARNGNLTRKDILDADTHTVTDRWSYTYSNHAATSINTTTHGLDRFVMQYDAAGNLTRQTDNAANRAKHMSYDHANRVTRVTNPATGETVGRYHYDDQGFRVRKTALDDDGVDRKETMLLYASMYFGVEIQKDVYTGDEIYNVLNNIYLNGVRVAAMVPTGEAAHFHTDQVDSVKVVTNDAGAVVSRMEYLPYGETWFQEGDDRFAPKYNSQELDRESGYYFYNARHYDPQICRFVTADTVIDGEFDTQGWNRYSYCKGNPIRYKDPTGHETVYEETVEGTRGERKEFQISELMINLKEDKPIIEKEYVGDELARTKTIGKRLVAGGKDGRYTAIVRMIENGKNKGTYEMKCNVKAGDTFTVNYDKIVEAANEAADKGHLYKNSSVIDKLSKNYEQNELKRKQSTEEYFKNEQAKGNTLGIKATSNDRKYSEKQPQNVGSENKKLWDDVTKEAEKNNIPVMELFRTNQPARK